MAETNPSSASFLEPEPPGQEGAASVFASGHRVDSHFVALLPQEQDPWSILVRAANVPRLCHTKMCQRITPTSEITVIYLLDVRILTVGREVLYASTSQVSR